MTYRNREGIEKENVSKQRVRIVITQFVLVLSLERAEVIGIRIYSRKCRKALLQILHYIFLFQSEP